MNTLRKWLARLSVLIGTVALAVFVPAAAWASSDVGMLLVDEAARRRRGFGSGLFALCCLVVVVLIVGVVLLLMRSRRSGPRR